MKQILSNKTFLLIIFLFIIVIFLLISIFMGSPKPTSSGSTNPSPSPTTSSSYQDEKQGKSDVFFSNAQEDFLESHPWYLNLPPRNEDYFINFNPEENFFFISLYPDSSPTIPTNERVEEIKTIVLKKLADLGIDTNAYKIEWRIIPR